MDLSRRLIDVLTVVALVLVLVGAVTGNGGLAILGVVLLVAAAGLTLFRRIAYRRRRQE